MTINSKFDDWIFYVCIFNLHSWRFSYKKVNNVLESKKNTNIYSTCSIVNIRYRDVQLYSYLVSDGSPTAGSGGNPSQCETRTLPVSCQLHAQQGLRAGTAAASAASAAAPAGSSAASQLRASALPFGNQPLGVSSPHTHQVQPSG